MMCSVTPNIKDQALKGFCKSINSEVEPIMVEVRSESKFKRDFCYDNVKQKISTDGGYMLLGWRIRKCPDCFCQYKTVANINKFL